MEETTTETLPVGGAGAPAQPTPPVETAAAQPQEPQSQSQPAQADDTAAWLQTKGVDPSDPEAFQKIAQMAYNSEKQMTKATQEASELRRSLGSQEPVLPQGGADPMMQEFIQDYRRDKQIGAFKDSHPDWSSHEPAMVKILGQTAPNGYTYSQLVNAGFMSLDAVYSMAKGSAPVDDIKTQAKQEVLQTLANTQRAGGSNAQASTQNPTSPSTDPVLEGIRKNRGQ